MAPLAHTRDDKPGYSGPLFLNARAALPGQRSVYDRAWHQLARDGGYPNSANFVEHLWTRDLSMLLCEKDPATVTALDAWLPSVRSQPRCKRAKVFFGKWQDRFDQRLPSHSQVGLPDESPTLVSCDPNMYSLRDAQPTPEKLYPHDLTQHLLPALAKVFGPVIIQLSTYDSARGQAAQNDVHSSIDQILREGRFTLAAKIRLNGNMMSLVYARDIWWWSEFANLRPGFSRWIGGLN